MATEKRLIDAHDLWSDIMMLPHNWDVISSEEVEQAIKDAPTVDAVEVVHGRWIKVHEWCGVEVYRCSACGREHPRLKTAYCCDCGAKMDLKGE